MEELSQETDIIDAEGMYEGTQVPTENEWEPVATLYKVEALLALIS